MPKMFELNEEEMDWLDNGNGFCALDNLPKKDYNEISYGITLKIRESYNQAELKNENRYFLTLTREEIDCTYDIMVDLLIDFEYQNLTEEIEDILPEFREESINEFKETMALTNGIFKKMEKPLQTLESLKEYQKQMTSPEDKE